MALMTALWFSERIRSRPSALSAGRLIGLPLVHFVYQRLRARREVVKSGRRRGPLSHPPAPIQHVHRPEGGRVARASTPLYDARSWSTRRRTTTTESRPTSRRWTATPSRDRSGRERRRVAGVGLRAWLSPAVNSLTSPVRTR